MHHTSHSSSAPRRTASIRFASLIHTPSKYSESPLRTGGMKIGSEIPATSRSRSTVVWGMASIVFRV